MAIKPVVCCDQCDQMIDKTTTRKGYAVSGNINCVDPLASDGIGGGLALVGDNLCHGDDEEGGRSIVKNISYFCEQCFVSVVFGDNVHLVSKDNPLKREITQSQMNDSIPYNPPKRR